MSKELPKKQPSPSDEKSQRNNYMKYSGMAFQMGIIILIGTLIGQKLDARYQTEKPYITIVFALLSIFAALFITLKDIIRNN